MVRRSASFSIAVLSNSTASTSTTVATSSTARIAVAPTSHASRQRQDQRHQLLANGLLGADREDQAVAGLMVARKNRTKS